MEEINQQCEVILNENVKPLFEELDKKIPSGEYFRYNDQWRFLTSRLAFACALMHYTRTDQVASRDQVASMLGCMQFKCYNTKKKFCNKKSNFCVKIFDLAPQYQ